MPTWSASCKASAQGPAVDRDGSNCLLKSERRRRETTRNVTQVLRPRGSGSEELVLAQALAEFIRPSYALPDHPRGFSCPYVLLRIVKEEDV